MLRHRVTIALYIAQFVLLTLGVASGGWAADCSIDSTDLDRGQRKPFFFCSQAITPDYALTGGLAKANIKVDYHQYLQRCAMDDKRPGIFFWLDAGSDAASVMLGVKNSRGEALCEPVRVNVPDRARAGAASLTPLAAGSPNLESTIHRLEIEAGAGQDFSNSCAAGLRFRPGKTNPTPVRPAGRS